MIASGQSWQFKGWKWKFPLEVFKKGTRDLLTDVPWLEETMKKKGLPNVCGILSL